MKRIMHIIRLIPVVAVIALFYAACDDNNGISSDDPVIKPDSTAIDIPFGKLSDYAIYQNDGIVRYIDHTMVDSVRYAANKTLLVYYLKDSCVVSFSRHMLDSVTFKYPEGRTVSVFPIASNFISAIENANAPASKDMTEPSAPSNEDASDYGDYIENFGVKDKNTITFTWSGNNVTWSGTVPSGVSIIKDNGHVTVKSTKSKMRYRLQGTTEDGSFKIANMNVSVTDDNNKKFILELNGVDITNPNGPAINIQSGKTVLVNMPMGKVNSLKDGTTYTQIDGESRKGTFFSEGQLVFSGPGTLNVTSLGGHGICSDDYIRLRYNVGEINITAAKDGINTKDYFLMYGGTLKINSSGDGVGVRRGQFELYGGSLDITCSDDGVVSDYVNPDTAFVKIGGGSLKVATTGSKGHAVVTTGKLIVEKGTVTASTQGTASKGFNAGGDITVKDSYVNLLTQGDPQYDEDEKDWSSAACIRAKSALAISGSDVFLLSSGQGSKCINAAAEVNIGTSTVTMAATGTDYNGGDNNVRSRAIDVVSLTVGSGTYLGISAAKTAIHTESGFDIIGGNTFAYTLSADSKAVNVKGTFSQTGGLLMSGLSE